MKQSVGKKACLVGQALEVHYFRGRNYLEVRVLQSSFCVLCSHIKYWQFVLNFQLGIDVGSSTVARGVVSLVLGYLNNLVIEMAFLIQVKTTVFLLKLFTSCYLVFEQHCYSYCMKRLVYANIWFFPQGNTPEELPEFLLGTCRLNHLDVSKSIPTDSVSIS